VSDIIQKAAALLRNAAERLRRPGAWTKRNLASDSKGRRVHPCDESAQRWCVLGALAADRGVPLSDDQNNTYEAIKTDPVLAAATKAIQKIVAPESYMQPYHEVYGWNDIHARDGDVPKVLDRAAAYLEQDVSESLELKQENSWEAPPPL
jgi:hypothetical protein